MLNVEAYITIWILNTVHFNNKLLFHDSSQECVAQLNMRQLLSVGMDGPNVNFKLMDLLQKEHAELHGGAQVISVGSCIPSTMQ